MTYTGAPVGSSPVTAYDPSLGVTLVYVANTAGDLEAINESNGANVWSDFFGSQLYATPTIYGGNLWVGTFGSGRMMEINAFTGAVECNLSLKTGEDLSSPTIATPPGGKLSVFYGVIDNSIVSSPVTAVNEATCAVEWTDMPYPAGDAQGDWNPASYGVDKTGEPLVFTGSGNPASSVYAMDANTGKLIWSNQNLKPVCCDVGAGITVSPPGVNGFADGMVYYPGLDGRLYAIDMTTGKTVWTFNFKAATTPSAYSGGRSAAALVGDQLVFGTGTGVMDVNAVTGVEVWDSAHTVAPASETVASPLIAGPRDNRVVVYGGLDGTVRVLSLETGDELYSFQTQGYIEDSPADANGSILLASSDGFLYSFGLGGTTSTDFPTTKITSPANGAVLVNPNSKTSTTAMVTTAGTAMSADPAPDVLVAIQQDGADGSWWDAATKSWSPGLAWNQATVTDTGPTTASWTFEAPVGHQGGIWHMYARAQDDNGLGDRTGASSTVTIDQVTTGPRVVVSSPTVGPSGAIEVSAMGFGAGESVQFTLPGGLATDVLGTQKSSSTGYVKAFPVEIPATYPYGVSAITATGETSKLEGYEPIDVTSPWTEYGENAARTGYLPYDEYLQAQEVPDRIYRMSPSVVYNTGAPISSSPAVANGIAYVGNSAGNLEAFNISTGDLAWEATTGGAVDSSPALDLAATPPLVIVGSDDDNVYAFNLQTGAVVWTRSTGGEVESSPTIVDGVVYIGSDDGSLYALSESSGAVLWSAAMSGSVISSPAVDVTSGLAIVGDSSGDVTAFNISGSDQGSVVWTYATGGAVNDTPIIDYGAVYVGSDNGTEYSLSETTGAINWTAPLGGDPANTSAVISTNLYVGSSTGEVYDLDPSTGDVNWSQDSGGPVSGIAATVQMVYTESSNGNVDGYRQNHENLWVDSTTGGDLGTPAVSDNAVLIGSQDSGLYVFTPYGLPMQ